MKYCVIIFTNGRNEYLEKTMKSLKEKVKFDENPFFILICDNPNRDLDFIDKFRFKYKIDKLILNGEKLGIAGSVQKAWSEVPEKCQYIFHQEDDFTYNKTIDVSVMAQLLSRNKNIFQIALQRQPWYDHELKAGTLFCEPDYRNGNFAGVDLVFHKKYFTHNPSLYRKEITAQINGYGEYSFISHLRRQNSSGWCAFLGATKDEPLVTHIGEKKL